MHDRIASLFFRHRDDNVVLILRALIVFVGILSPKNP